MNLRSKLQSALLVLGGIALGLCFAEGLTRVFSPQTPTTVLYRPDPHTVFRTLAHLDGHQTTDGKTISVKTNSLGFRMPEELATPKPKGEVRVLCVGDSYTFGWGVEWEDTFLAHLDRKARAAGFKLTFVNAGNPGWGTENMLAFLENYGRRVEPDYVVLFMGPNDVEDNHGSEIYRLGSDGKLVKRELKKSNPQFLFRFLSSIPGYVWLSDRSHFVTLFRKSIRQVMESRQVYLNQPDSIPALRSPTATSEENPSSEEVFQETEALFLRLRELVATWGVPLTVANIGPAIGPTRAFLHRGESWFKKVGIDFVFVPPRLDREEDYLMSDRHFNEMGNHVYADLVWPPLKTRFQSRFPKNHP